MKNILIILNVFLSALFYTQGNDNNRLNAEFIYLTKAKIDKTIPYIHEEIFLLQVVQDKAFFVSENSVKYDSILKNDIYRATVSASKGGSINISRSSSPKTKFGYTIVQSHQETQYFEKIDGKLYSYPQPIIKDWKLLEETQTINTLQCKKATLHHKGRHWTAWYAPDIPLPYGPYTFTGLPGLIVKMDSQDGEYSFELVKSTPKNKLNNKELSISKSKYENATSVTFSEMREIKKNTIERLITEAPSMGIQLSNGNIQTLRELQKQKLKNFLNENLIEKTEN
ncbi:GLPGLI family protein [Bergeyella zoohelcum]|uniref:GLPGLI family protein n=1 Tax=Bergeyella zoohelcum TaxID=1015 RepID=UPI0037357131